MPPARKPVAAKPVVPEMPQKLLLPGISLGEQNLLLDMGVIDPVKGKSTSLRSLATSKGIAMIFISNTCAEVQTQKKAILHFEDQALTAGLGVVYVNSNQRKMEETENPAAMREFAMKEGMKQPYLYDLNMQMTDAFGVQRLPEVFIFNANGKLVYRGAIQTNPAGTTETVCSACRALVDIEDVSKIRYDAVTAGKGCAVSPRE